MENKVKALVLVSGGLDSRLASKILQEQGIEVEAVLFLLPFSGGCCSDKYCVFRFTQSQNLKLHIIDVTKGKLFKEYMEMLRRPKFSRGTALNPCIDCHLFILRKAKEFADKKKIEVIATGEVLGERPLSQNKKALLLIEKELGFPVLRPLSAKLLPETSYEKSGLVNRDKLLDIKGRTRRRQIELAQDYGIDYPSPGGGCVLCEPGFCEKLKPILNNKKLTYNDIKLLSIGRHFLDSKIILGRNKIENELLEKQQEIKIIPEQPGPTALVKDKKLIEKAKELIRKYSKHNINEFEIK